MSVMINNVQKGIKRGDIFLVNLPDSKGSIQGGFMRPMIVVANPLCCKHSSVIHAVPTTGRVKKWMPTHVEILVNSNSGLLRDSTALCEQVQLLTKDMLIEKIGHCGNYIMDEIDRGLMVQFGLVEGRNNVACAN